MKWLVLGLLFLISCTPNSSSDFIRQGKGLCRELTIELEKIETREQLVQKEAKLKKIFESLVDLMISAREFQYLQDDASFEFNLDTDSIFEYNLEQQMRRIYAIEGGREVIERCQQEALIRLDGFERKLAKKKIASRA